MEMAEQDATARSEEPRISIVEPGDELDVVVRIGTLVEKYPGLVRADGTIKVAFETVLVNGLTELAAEKHVAESIARVIKNPDVTLRILKKAEPPEEYFYVLGEVSRPGKFKIGNRTTILQAISEARGYKETAALNEVRLISQGQDPPRIQLVNLDQVLLHHDLQGDRRVQHNDVVFVPRTKLGNYNAYVKQLLPTLDGMLDVAELVFISKSLQLLFSDDTGPAATIPVGGGTIGLEP